MIGTNPKAKAADFQIFPHRGKKMYLYLIWIVGGAECARGVFASIPKQDIWQSPPCGTMQASSPTGFRLAARKLELSKSKQGLLR